MLWRRLRLALALLYLTAASYAARLLGRARPYGVLKLALKGEFAEGETEPRLLTMMLRRGADDYVGLLSLLRWARDDEKLRGVLVSLEGVAVGWARAQEIRRALQALRGAGKRVWVHLSHGGVREYLIATGAERIVVEPSSVLEVAGIAAEATFFLGALEKLGIDAEIVQVGQYKSAAEPFLRRGMSPEHREMIEAMVDDLWEQAVAVVAETRGMPAERARQTLGSGPFVAQEAVESGLVDGAGYADEIEQQLRDECGGAVIERADYQRQRGREARRQVLRSGPASIALVHVTGTIKTGDSLPGPLGMRATGADPLVAELHRLEERDDVRAVVLRVSSPGGSGQASDQIWRAVGKLREKKPVVVSLGDVAASGGYYIAAAGDAVLAEAGTITGSIGVIAGKANLRGLYDHLGITKETVSRGKNALLYSDYVPLGKAERERLEKHAHTFYAEFVNKVAAGRKLSPEAVESVAQGRVWTGQQALAHGLVDAIGGLEEALAEAKRRAGMPREKPVAVERFPRPRRFWRASLRLAPAESRLGGLLPWLPLLGRERILAVLPFRLRFL